MKTRWSYAIGVALALNSALLMSPRGVDASVPDVDISDFVKDALRDDPRVKAYEVTVTTEHGLVTLSGSVDNLAAKTFAVAEAKKINGRSVVPFVAAQNATRCRPSLGPCTSEAWHPALPLGR